jgi:colanic acid biosynthesis glycosyl transferase WcaI
MRVLIVNQFFPPDQAPTGQMAADLAEDLVAGGAVVTVLAGRGAYLGGGRHPAREAWRGVDVRRVAATSLGRGTLLRRAVDYATFYLGALGAVLSLSRHDVVVAMTTPPLIGAAGLVAKWFKGARLVYWVQDLYPEVAVALGVLGPRSLLTGVMGWTSRVLMRKADGVVALGERMRARCLALGAKPASTIVIPNWCDDGLIRPVGSEASSLRKGLAEKASTVVMYSGNMGRAHDVETLLGAARLLADRPDIHFVFVGDGAKRDSVSDAARALPTLRLEPYAPRERLAESLSAGDLHLIALSRNMEGLVEPSKLYGIMAVGRPALYVGPEGSEVALTLLRERCGRVIRNGDCATLAGEVRALADDPEARAAMGARARQAIDERYGRRVATRRFREFLEALTGRASGQRAA